MPFKFAQPLTSHSWRNPWKLSITSCASSPDRVSISPSALTFRGSSSAARQ